MRNLIVASLAIAVAAPTYAAVPVNGRWLTAEKDSIIEVGPCGPNICGRIAKILAPTVDGKPARDSNNPNPALRNRLVEGLTLLTGFTDNGKNWKGTIYDPRAGKTYKSYLTKLANGNLQVQGCIGPFCKSFIYSPVR